MCQLRSRASCHIKDAGVLTSVGKQVATAVIELTTLNMMSDLRILLPTSVQQDTVNTVRDHQVSADWKLQSIEWQGRHSKSETSSFVSHGAIW